MPFQIRYNQKVTLYRDHSQEKLDIKIFLQMVFLPFVHDLPGLGCWVSNASLACNGKNARRGCASENRSVVFTISPPISHSRVGVEGKVVFVHLMLCIVPLQSVKPITGQHSVMRSLSFLSFVFETTCSQMAKVG